MAANAAGVLAVAASNVGFHEGYSNGHWNNKEPFADQVPGLSWANYQAWCATFVSYCAYKAGAGSLYPLTASCLTGVAWFKNAGRWSEYPAVGAQIFFGPGGGTHTGLVVDFDSTYVYTIEGNTNANGGPEGDGVYHKTRVRRDSYVYGYGYPKFAEGIKSADPAYAGKGPVTPSKPVVDLSNVVAAAHTDPGASQGHQSYPNDVRLVEAALSAEGLLASKYASDGSFGSTTVSAYAAYQRKLGFGGSDADGIPGMTTLAKLGAAHGFTVKA